MPIMLEHHPIGAAERLRFLVGDWKQMVSSRTLGPDLSSALTVACVALPLNLALAVASGLPASVGLISGAIAGVVAGMLGGARLQVTGPEAALVPIVLLLVQRHGIGGMVVATLLCGLLQILLGVLRVGRLAKLLPAPVVRGFMAGIGLILLNSQLPRLLGLETSGTFSSVLSQGGALGVHAGGLALGVLVMACMVGLPRLHKRIPAVLVGLVVASALGALLGPELARVGSLPPGLPPPRLPSLEGIDWSALLPDAFSLALLASLGSLMSASAIDQLPAAGNHRTDHDQELMAQGMANLASSLFGGMPVMGAIVRSSVSIQAGARTRAAAVLHALLLLGVCLVAGPLVARVPIAALAGILVVVGVRLLDVPGARALWAKEPAQVAVVVVTASVIASVDLLLGLGAGVALSIALVLMNRPRTESQVRTLRLDGRPFFRSLGAAAAGQDDQPPIQRIRITGPLDFLSPGILNATLTRKPFPRYLVLDLSAVPYMDATGLKAVLDLRDCLGVRGGVLVVVARGEVARLLEQGGLPRSTPLASLVPSYDEALEQVARTHKALPSSYAPQEPPPMGA
ncbi:SulP family inorganic anion transporter [Pyxidicoccus fallax]|uniref:SulP family inorganic anion transporter n=1 Tax=Pyxidicoccus fallax TaxID=394095 RepID=A0A848L5X9_9BACT|nr:SulP family inorganic anion transporter [Pyxidicoccus fallax]NMO14119.1 SulP family inorganic anion transporter [Pyxidicoccus fallax]NPC78004.1 SulP family inorganic anion transporter [Pyxidicoccus fallax]